jgi:DNA-binding response OmpR family regulator
MAFSKRILLAGDEARLIQIVRQALEETGKHLIEEERNYRTAIETARRFQPNIIFFDLGRCGVDWSEAIGQIKANIAFAGTPIFMLTLSPNADSVIYCGSLNGYEFSISPMKIEDLVSAIQTMVKA